ncbi:hypothetical protein [Streptomyces sp. NBC_01601]|uniref:hypothetical protein n=1 Tax=Streptomyces sp. NBC_01601 TaxID=2975892 RepID=UPI002E2BABC1|nr:hypothetical protein [Streptomyces sp. NBC_01601]
MTDTPTAPRRPSRARSALAALRLLLAARAGRHPGVTLAAQFDAQLLAAADAAVSLARRTLYDVTWYGIAPRERLAARGEVTVEDVAEIMRTAHGILFIPPERIARALRTAYEARAGYIDLRTDAYDR